MSRTRKKWGKPAAAAVSLTSSEYTATASGLENVYFIHGSKTAAAEFGVTRSMLVRHIDSKDKGSFCSKAMEEMKLLTLTDTTKRVR